MTETEKSVSWEEQLPGFCRWVKPLDQIRAEGFAGDRYLSRAAPLPEKDGRGSVSAVEDVAWQKYPLTALQENPGRSLGAEPQAMLSWTGKNLNRLVRRENDRRGTFPTIRTVPEKGRSGNGSRVMVADAPLTIIAESVSSMAASRMKESVPTTVRKFNPSQSSMPTEALAIHVMGRTTMPGRSAWISRWSSLVLSSRTWAALISTPKSMDLRSMARVAEADRTCSLASQSSPEATST